MAGERASPIRPEVRHGQGITEVVFRRPGRWTYALTIVGFGAVWLFGLGFAAVLLGATGRDNTWFLGLWMALWGAGGIAVFCVLLWGLLGIESLVAHSDRLVLVRRLLLWRVPNEMPAASIAWIDWIFDDPDRKVTVNGQRIPQPAIAIATGKEVLRCARGISEAEAAAAIAALRQRLVLPRGAEP
jgi:hypothetical protein